MPVVTPAGVASAESIGLGTKVELDVIEFDLVRVAVDVEVRAVARLARGQCDEEAGRVFTRRSSPDAGDVPIGKPARFHDAFGVHRRVGGRDEHSAFTRTDKDAALTTCRRRV